MRLKTTVHVDLSMVYFNGEIMPLGEALKTIRKLRNWKEIRLENISGGMIVSNLKGTGHVFLPLK